MVVDSRGEHVGNEVGIFLVDKQREGQWLLPEAINQVLQDIDPLLTIELVIGEGISVIPPLPI